MNTINMGSKITSVGRLVPFQKLTGAVTIAVLAAYTFLTIVHFGGYLSVMMSSFGSIGIGAAIGGGVVIFFLYGYTAGLLSGLPSLLEEANLWGATRFDLMALGITIGAFSAVGATWTFSGSGNEVWGVLTAGNSANMWVNGALAVGSLIWGVVAYADGNGFKQYDPDFYNSDYSRHRKFKGHDSEETHVKNKQSYGWETSPESHRSQPSSATSTMSGNTNHLSEGGDSVPTITTETENEIEDGGSETGSDSVNSDKQEGEGTEDSTPMSELEYDWQTDTGIDYGDVGGMKGVKNDLQMQVIDPLTDHSDRAEELGITVSNVLLEGPPGTGKTYIAKATATELDMPTVLLSTADIKSKWINQTPKQIKDLFDEAEIVADEHGGALIFLDEVDTLLGSRGNAGHEEDTKAVNQFLTHLEETADSDIVVMGATNRANALDKAATRPGRFDTEITVGLPSKETRKAVLTVSLNERAHSLTTTEIERISEATEGLSNADLAAAVDGAAKIAYQNNSDEVTESDLWEALKQVAN